MEESPMTSCPKCGKKNNPYAIECQKCGIIFKKYEQIQQRKVQRPKMQETTTRKADIGAIPSINCNTCGSEKSMGPTQIHKFGGIVLFIGYLIVIPSVLGVLFAVLIFISTVSASSDVMATAQSDPEKAGAAIGAAMGLGMAAFIGVGSLISGLIGWLLIMKKKVFKCASCGFILDRD